VIRYYNLQEGLLHEGSPDNFSIRIFSAPTAAELEILKSEYGLKQHKLVSASDPDEEPRLEIHEGHL